MQKNLLLLFYMNWILWPSSQLLMARGHFTTNAYFTIETQERNQANLYLKEGSGCKWRWSITTCFWWIMFSVAVQVSVQVAQKTHLAIHAKDDCFEQHTKERCEHFFTFSNQHESYCETPAKATFGPAAADWRHTGYRHWDNKEQSGSGQRSSTLALTWWKTGSFHCRYT